METNLYNFDKRIKSGRFPRSQDLPTKVTQNIANDGSQTICISNNEAMIQITNLQQRKVILNHGPNTKVYHFSPKKQKNQQSFHISQLGMSMDDAALDREGKVTKIINMQLEMGHQKIKSPLKARNRFASRQKVHQRDMSIVCAGQERKTLMDYIKNKQDTFLQKDPYNKFTKLQPIKKQEDQFTDCIHRRLLHIQKVKPIARIRDKQGQDKKIQSYTDSKLSQTIVKTKDNQFQIQVKTQYIQVGAFEKQQKLIKQTPLNRKLDIETFSEYALSKKGFSGRKDFFVFGLSERPQDSINKIEIYRDFLWKINFTNGLFVEPEAEIDRYFKVFIGKGNNSMLVRGLMKRRFWWTIVDKPEDAHFSWSQLKNVQLIKQQKFSIVSTLNNPLNTLSSKSINMQIFTPREQTPTQFKKRSKSSKKRHKSNADSDNQKSVLDRVQIIQKHEKQIQPQIKDPHNKIYCQKQMILWNKHMQKYSKAQANIDEKTYLKRSWLLKFKEAVKIQNNDSLLVTNHFITNTFIGNKKAMFYSMRKYYQLKKENVFSVLPMTFHISKGIDDPQYQKFMQAYLEFEEQKKSDRTIRNIWIAKPGQFTNRGTGITVCASLDDIKLRLRGRQKNANGTSRTFILQKYIEKPLLYNKRKFDIRHYILITCINGMFKAYWYQQGYLRTSSYEFSTKNYRDPQIHLTNDAIQKNNQSYGKYEKGNKLSYSDFQKYLDVSYKGKNYDFFNIMLPKMKVIATNAVKASYFLLDSEKRHHNFQIFGLDFMIDEQFNPWLIQINTNPCLQLGSPLLARLIPGMVENALKIGLDPLFPPPYIWQVNRKYQLGDDSLNNNKFQLIFDESTEGNNIQQLYKNVEKIDRNMGEIEQEDEQFQEQTGKQWDGEL